MELKKTKDVVLKVMIRHPKTKDCDELLFCRVYQELGTSCTTPFNDIMRMIHNNELPTLESIRRCRQKLQETHPELRGTNYAKRHEKQQDYLDMVKEK